MSRWIACSVLAISELTSSEAKILVSPSVRADLVTLAVGEFNAGDVFFSIDALVYIKVSDGMVKVMKQEGTYN